MRHTNYPKALQKAEQNLHRLFQQYRYGGGRVRAMRPERQENLTTLLTELLKLSCLQFDGAACVVRGGKARPVVVPELVRRTGIPQRNLERCLADLREMGLLATGRQIRHRGLNGGFVVSSVLRMLTRAFWEAVGAWSLFVEGVKYAAAKARLTLVFPQYRGGRKPQRGNFTTLEAQRAALLCPRFNDSGCRGGHQAADVCAACVASRQTVQRC